MRRRELSKGFSLVELLIVLAVIAALIAVVTPLSLNAMRRATAVRIAYNMKALSKAMDQHFYLGGISSLENMTIGDLGRNVDGQNWGVLYVPGTDYSVAYIFTRDDLHFDTLRNILPAVTRVTPGETLTGFYEMAGGLGKAAFTPQEVTAVYRVKVGTPGVGFGAFNYNVHPEYIEIVNNTSRTVSLQGWVIKDRQNLARFTRTIGNYSLKPGGVLRYYSPQTTNGGDQAEAAAAEFTNEEDPELRIGLFWGGSPVWRDAGDIAFLFDNNGVLIDYIAYGNQSF
jgi:general secretion pathway protein G